MKKLPLHWQIIIALVLGLAVGIGLTFSGLGQFSSDWIKPFGTIFINLLKLIAVPLVLASLIKGVSSLSDMSRLSAMGGRTAALYLFTTVVAVVIGLVIVNITRPGEGFSEEVREEFRAKYGQTTSAKLQEASEVTSLGPLQPVVDIFPSNIFEAAADNKNMLQVILFAMLFGIAMVMLPKNTTAPVQAFFDGLNDIVIQIVNIVMLFAPYGVFALMASLIVDFAGNDPSRTGELLIALGNYSLTVVGGLLIMLLVVYPMLLKIFTKVSIMDFYQKIAPAQLMAFTTSSSAATLPVTMDCLESRMKISKETTSFVLPLGATVNMDGTCLYQGVAAVFIAQAYGLDLSLGQQLGIVVTATLASIGAAAVPGAGVVMLIIVLEQAGIPIDGIALILAPDRLLDMCRTVVNVTSDTVVAVIVDKHKDGGGKAN